ncbi:hypothetical protein [Methylovorus glucosotrophus]|uniref:Uncharacterized protein n=1 Tax=Methylovorus glucosotrophus (strain SIP3-4) TaxID=582744 RepID=C6XE86_METGS|nr:hypothetical protein [Methylovorus glucosotrophus]ACT50861.1 conserved hypothetical protein [Methylovorus glucosotrophus SIP3-4]
MNTGQLGTPLSMLGLFMPGAVGEDEIIESPTTVTESSLKENVVTLCWPNRISQSVLTGGAWRPTLPLSNVANRVFAKKARSLDATEASTQFRISLDKSRPIAVVSLAAHNFTQSAKVRVVAYTDLAATTIAYDTSFKPAWPSSYLLERLEWEDNNFWFGETVLDSGSEYTPLTTLFFDDLYNCQAIDVFISDTTNGDGYIDIGRCFLASAWQPEFNISYGITHGHIINTEIDEAYDGTEYFDRKRAKRTASFDMRALDRTEAFAVLYAMQRDLGIDRELLYAYELAETDASFYRTFIARIKQPDPIAQPYYDTFNAPLNIQEIL